MDDNVFSPDWMVKAFFVTFFCCPPIGLVGLIYRIRAHKLYYHGDYRSARVACKKAQKWINIAIACGTILWACLGILLLTSLFE